MYMIINTDVCTCGILIFWANHLQPPGRIRNTFFNELGDGVSER